MCLYFFNKYGVRRLVQKRLQELLSTLEPFAGDVRVSFFMRACGLCDEEDSLPEGYLEYYGTLLRAIWSIEVGSSTY